MTDGTQALLDSLRQAAEELTAACETAFIGEEDLDWSDDEDVSSPSSGITFGMIRRARAALENLEADRG